MMDDIVGYYRCHNFQVSAQLPIQIGRGAGQFAQEFFDHIPQEIRNSFNMNFKKVIKNHRYREAAACFRRVRIKMIRKDGRILEGFFKSSIYRFSPEKAQIHSSLINLTGCLKIDIEAAARVAGKSRLR